MEQAVLKQSNDQMQSYFMAIWYLSKLFEELRDKYLHDYLNIDIDEWVNHKSVDHHLAAYGRDGLGDLFITTQNFPLAKHEFLPWAQELKDAICSISRKYAENYKMGTESKISMEIIVNDKEEFYKSDPILHSFFVKRCEECGCASVEPKTVEAAIARLLSFKLVRDYFYKEGKLIDFDFIINLDEVAMVRNEFIRQIEYLNYHYSEKGGLHNFCNQCGSKNIGGQYIRYSYDNGKVVLRPGLEG